MNETNPLYFSDFLMESGVSQCDWCGGLEGDQDVQEVMVDAGEGARLCAECREGCYLL